MKNYIQNKSKKFLSVKTKKPFTLDDSEPEFDPSREESLNVSETTVPSEIIANNITARDTYNLRRNILDALALPKINKLWDDFEDWVEHNKDQDKEYYVENEEEIEDEFFANCIKKSRDKL